MLFKYNIRSNKNVSLSTILGDPVKIQEWNINKLPKDAFSTENAIIDDNSDRWSLMIDPQMQAFNWLMATYSQGEESNLKIIKPTMEDKLMSRALETSLKFVYPVILVDATESFNPMLEPVISKQIQKRGAEYFINFNQTPITYDPNFKFYITTKMPRPHYPPETCVKVTLLNFMVTQEGL